MPAELLTDLIPTADLRPLAPGPWGPPDVSAPRALLASIEARGVIEPLFVRSASVRYTVQPGRRTGTHGYFVLDPRLVRGDTAYAGDPPFFLDRRAARRALPADVPWEVVRGHGRLAAARRLRLRLLPCVIAELTDDEVAELRELRPRPAPGG